MYSIGAEVISLLKLNTYSYLYSLIDITGMDLTKLKNYNLFFNTDVAHMQPMFFERCVIYNLIDYNNNGRYLFTYFLPQRFNNTTLSEIFFNANWLERELVEFFNMNISGRSDTRNLLLDYNFTANPLLKHYPTEGHQEIFFNHLTYNLEYVNSEFVEL
jgi:NADH:ubiquinone oxidoreductase subunit C